MTHKRILKTLDRIDRRKSLPDWGGLNMAEGQGYVTCGPDPEGGGLLIEMTDKGKQALQAHLDEVYG